jgi:hypothetical protein
MNREQLRNRASGRIEKFRLDDGAEVLIRPLSALDRAKLLDDYRQMKPAVEGQEVPLEEIIRTQYFVVSRSLVGDDGSLLYQEDDIEAMSAEIDWKTMDAITAYVLRMSGMAGKDDAEKNLQPIPEDGLTSA